MQISIELYTCQQLKELIGNNRVDESTLKGFLLLFLQENNPNLIFIAFFCLCLFKEYGGRMRQSYLFTNQNVRNFSLFQESSENQFIVTNSPPPPAPSQKDSVFSQFYFQISLKT